MKKLFVIIQPLQYLQALEYKNDNDINILIVPWADKNNQVIKILNNSDWNEIIYLKYKGTLWDIFTNHMAIRKIISKLGKFDEIILSSFFNPLMNLISNSLNKTRNIILEDGMATLHLDSKNKKSFKYYTKLILCKIIGFDISPIKKPTLFLLERKDKIEVPVLAKEAIYYKFHKLKSKILTYEQDSSIYFINSAYINGKMISKENYMDFLSKLSKQFANKGFKIFLHRFDDPSDFSKLEKFKNIKIIKLDIPIELYFYRNKIRPDLLITAGSGATETLDITYGFNIEIFFPKVDLFFKKYQGDILKSAAYLKKSYNVKFI